MKSNVIPDWLLDEKFSKQRFLSINHLPKREKGFCRWCGAETPPTRTRWCSQNCVDNYMIRNSSNMVRHHVKIRDKGICSNCGINCEEVRALMVRCWRLHKGERQYDFLWSKSDRKNFFSQWGPWGNDSSRSLWEADHIVPVIEGGGCCGLDNYRTLCLACHKRETAHLAKRRSGKPIQDILL